MTTWTRWQRLRLAVVLWWRRLFWWRQWDMSETPHRVFRTRCRTCGAEVMNVAPITDVTRIAWECARCFRFTAFEVRS